MAVLAMTVGFIRTETADDLPILSAAGASSRTRRNLTGALPALSRAWARAGAYAAMVP